MSSKWVSVFPGKTSLYSAPSCLKYRLLPFVNKKKLFSWWSACSSSLRWSADMLKNSKWRSWVIIHDWLTSKDDEYSDALEVAASAGASILAKFVLFEYNHMVIVKANTENQIFMIWVERETPSYNIDESVWYKYVYNIYAKWNLLIKSLFKLLINLLH